MYHRRVTLQSWYLVSILVICAGTFLSAAELTREMELACRIELELLGDPLTFPYNWRVDVTPHGVQLAGTVPGDDVRERALYIASRVTNVPIHDRILVQAFPRPTKLPPRSPRELGEAVRQCLEQVQLGAPGGTVEINIYPDASGVVTLQGYVPSIQDKLLASRCLRNLTQCLAVRNLLEVRPSPDSVSESQNPLALSSHHQDDRPDPFVWRPTPLQPLTNPRIPTGRTWLRGHQSVSPPLYPTMRQIVALAPNAKSSLIPATISSANIAGLPSFPNTISAPAPIISQPSPSMTIGNGYARMPNPIVPAPISSMRTQSSSTPPIITSASASFSAQGSSVVKTTPSPLTSASSNLTVTPGTHVITYSPMPNVKSADSTVSYPIAFSIRGPQNSSEPLNSATRPPDYPSMRTLPSVPAVTGSEVSNISRPTPIISNTLAQGPISNTNAFPVVNNAQQIRGRIVSALSPDATDVQILDSSGKTLRVRVRVPSVEAIDRVAPRLFQLPELEGYEVKAEFEVTAPLGR